MSKVGKRKEKYLKKVNRLEIDETGEECPRCGRASVVRVHVEITEKLLSQAYFYSKWFCCRHKDCKTGIFYNERYKVLNEGLIPEKGTNISKSNLNWNEGSHYPTPPWLTDEEYKKEVEQELRLAAIKQQLRPR